MEVRIQLFWSKIKMIKMAIIASHMNPIIARNSRQMKHVVVVAAHNEGLFMNSSTFKHHILGCEIRF